MAKTQPLTTCSAVPTTFARSRFAVSIVPMMNGRSMRVRPSDCAAMVMPVSTIVAAKPQRRIDGRFIAMPTTMQEVVVITGASAGGEAIVLPLDVSDADAVEQAAAMVER